MITPISGTISDLLNESVGDLTAASPNIDPSVAQSGKKCSVAIVFATGSVFSSRGDYALAIKYVNSGRLATIAVQAVAGEETCYLALEGMSLQIV
jgi:hypothetical protein